MFMWAERNLHNV